MAVKRSVLVVEDDETIRLTLRDFLKKFDYEVYVASDGVGGIQQILDNEIEVVVTDYRMEVLGGQYWIKFLERFCSDKSVIITSGYLESDFPIPYPILKKPFEYSVLESMIAEHFGDCEA